MTERKYWDIGEADIITRSKDKLSSILNAIILCQGHVHDSHSLEAINGKWRYPTRSCSVVFRISLPEGMEERFKELSKCKLTTPPVVRGSSDERMTRIEEDIAELRGDQDRTTDIIDRM